MNTKNLALGIDNPETLQIPKDAMKKMLLLLMRQDRQAFIDASLERAEEIAKKKALESTLNAHQTAQREWIAAEKAALKAAASIHFDDDEEEEQDRLLAKSKKTKKRFE